MSKSAKMGCGEWGCLYVLLLIGAFIFKGCAEDAKNEEARREYERRREERENAPSTVSTARNNWLEGGTLNNVSAAEWRNGSQRNKVATSGGWIFVWVLHQKAAKTYQTDDEVKVDAELLAREIDSMITEDAWRNTDNITLVAVLAGSRLNLIKY